MNMKNIYAIGIIVIICSFAAAMFSVDQTNAAGKNKVRIFLSYDCNCRIINDNGKYMVRYLKADDTQKLDIEFEKFKEVINSKTWSDQQVNEFCKFTEQNKEDKDNENKDKKSNKDTYKLLLIIFGCADGVLIGIILFLCLYKRND